MKKILLLTIPLMLLFAPAVFACNPLAPFPDPTLEYGHYVGPEVVGTLTFTLGEDNNTYVSFAGSCTNTPVSLIPNYIGDSSIFNAVTPGWLLGDCGKYCISCSGCTGPQTLSFVALDLYPDKFVGPPVVYKVKQFEKYGNTIKCNIVGLFPVVTPIK